MSSNLSQDEINALLGGDAPPAADESAEAAAPEEEAVSTEEMAAAEDSPPAEDAPDVAEYLEEELTMAEHAVPSDDLEEHYETSDYLTADEVDILGEVGNICMGQVATTMYTLLDKTVSITTPHVHIHSTRQVLAEYQTPFIVVDVHYVEGVEGKNLLLLKEPDAMLITDLLMGGDGNVEAGTEINELHMSAISEIMNQMIGASATALSKMLGIPVNISTPRSQHVGINGDVSDLLDDSELVIKVSFNMEIEGLLKSQLLQLMPYSMGRNLAAQLLGVQNGEPEPPAPEPQPQPVAEPAPAPVPEPATSPTPPPPPMPTAAPAPYPPMPEPPMPGNLVDVRHAQYPSFDSAPQPTPGSGKDIGLVSDIPLQVSVELGKTKKTINEVLEFGVGTVVVLDKIAGEHVEVLVNGKLIASGEVVVIDENYGVRITEIHSS